MVKQRNIFAGIAAAFAAFIALFASRSAVARDATVGEDESEDLAPNIGPGIGGIGPVPLGSSGTLGLRNNNPFNLEFRNIGWRGELGIDSSGRFSVFDTAQNGIRAGMINIHTKMTRDGLNTVRKIISRLSPSFENPTEAFIQFVSRRLSVAADQPIQFGNTILPMSKAIIQFENGIQPFSNDELESALRETGRI